MHVEEAHVAAGVADARRTHAEAQTAALAGRLLALLPARTEAVGGGGGAPSKTGSLVNCLSTRGGAPQRCALRAIRATAGVVPSLWMALIKTWVDGWSTMARKGGWIEACPFCDRARGAQVGLVVKCSQLCRAVAQASGIDAPGSLSTALALDPSPRVAEWRSGHAPPERALQQAFPASRCSSQVAALGRDTRAARTRLPLGSKPSRGAPGSMYTALGTRLSLAVLHSLLVWVRLGTMARKSSRPRTTS